MKRRRIRPEQAWVALIKAIGIEGRRLAGFKPEDRDLEARIIPIDGDIHKTFLRAYVLKQTMQDPDWNVCQSILEGCAMYMQMSRLIQGKPDLLTEMMTADLRNRK